MYTGAGYFWIAERGVAGMGREIAPMYYARYIDWITTTPLMVWDILALAGAPNDDILQCVFIDILMIAFGCVGAQTPEGQKWYFFIIGMLCYFHVVQTLLKYNKSNKYRLDFQRLPKFRLNFNFCRFLTYPSEMSH